MKKLKILTFTIFTLLLTNQNSFAWSGYDFENKIDIDIESGNLVREGLTFQFYDSKTDNYHNAKVLFLEEGIGGQNLQVFDYETKQTRTFIME